MHVYVDLTTVVTANRACKSHVPDPDMVGPHIIANSGIYVEWVLKKTLLR